MANSRRLLNYVFMALIVWGLNGCAEGQKCDTLDQVTGGQCAIDSITDEQMVDFLSEADTGELQRSKYWKPLMLKALNAKISGTPSPGIPLAHLKAFVKDYKNSVDYPAQYNEAALLMFQQMSDKDLASFLTKVYEDPRDNKRVWNILVKALINGNMQGKSLPVIPRQDLKRYFGKPVEKYSQALYENAIYLWYKPIIEGKIRYHRSDRAFLEDYIQKCIRFCPDANCSCIKLCKDITAKLDQDLYRSYFKDKGPFERQ